MADPSLVMYENDFRMINDILARLLNGSKAKCIFLVDKNGQLITGQGDISHLDSTSIAALSAGNFAATSEIAKLLGENEFSILFHEGERDHLHVSVVASRVILVVIFDDRTSLGLVRLRVKSASEELSLVFTRIFEKLESEKRGRVTPTLQESQTFAQDEIDDLFRD